MTNPWSGAPTLTVLKDPPSRGAGLDLDAGITLLREVGSGFRPSTLRLYRPQPTVAFGQRDARLPGFDEACAAASAAGFEPLVRRAGGRAAAYHQGCLIVDHLEPSTDAIAATRARFAFFGGLFAEVLREVGVHAGVGETPGEYCPGEFSVHGATDQHHQVKLVGTAQRVVAGAWFFSSVIVVRDAAPIREVLVHAYDALALPWEPRTAGAVEDLVPGIGVDDVERALLAAYATHVTLA